MSHRVRFQRRLAVALPALALVFSAAAVAAQKAVNETADVVVVEVPVQVIRGGEPVRSLTAADFELFDGRKKVAFTDFEVLDLTSAPASATAQKSISAAARRHFLLLFDLTFSDPNALLRARGAAKEMLGKLHPTDLVGVATFSYLSGAQLAVGFTPDRAQVAAAIDVLGLPSFFHGSDPLRIASNEGGPSTPQPSSEKTGAAAATQEERDALVKQALDKASLLTSGAQRTLEQTMVRNMTTSFGQLAKVLGTIDGRKYVVFLSEGYDVSLVTGGLESEPTMEEQVDNPDPLVGISSNSGSDVTYGDTRAQNAVEAMIGEFKRADCQIQAVDIAGLRGLVPGNPYYDRRDSLFNMAKSTGGDLYENFTNLSTAMEQMLGRTGVTYVLSFQPAGLKPDGAFHKLRVEVKNAPGARVVHRAGYYAPRPYREQPPLQRLLDAADSLMGEEGGSLGTAVLAATYAGKGEQAYVPVVVEIDGASLLAGKQEAKLPVEIYVYAIDEQGVVHDFRTQTLALDLAKAESQLRQTGLKFFGHLTLPKGKYALRTLVRNGTTGASSLQVSDVTVPAAGEAVLLPPLFPEPAGRWVMVRETLAQGEQQPPYPFMLSGAPFIPSSRPVLLPGQAADVVLQGYNLGGDLQAKVEVLGADGSPQPGGTLELGKASGSSPRVVSGTFKAPQLRPGEYLLRVTVTDAAGKTATSVGAFTVGDATRVAARS